MTNRNNTYRTFNFSFGSMTLEASFTPLLRGGHLVVVRQINTDYPIDQVEFYTRDINSLDRFGIERATMDVQIYGEIR